jgi:hypothetical protein
VPPKALSEAIDRKQVELLLFACTPLTVSPSTGMPRSADSAVIPAIGKLRVTVSVARSTEDVPGARVGEVVLALAADARQRAPELRRDSGGSALEADATSRCPPGKHHAHRVAVDPVLGGGEVVPPGR